jgi:hypothetical protein
VRCRRSHEAWAREALRVAKPGAYLLAFGGTRTVHRIACAIEDAGWIIRDTLVWAYASGLPEVEGEPEARVGADRHGPQARTAARARDRRVPDRHHGRDLAASRSYAPGQMSWGASAQPRQPATFLLVAGPLTSS